VCDEKSAAVRSETILSFEEFAAVDCAL